MRRRFVFSLAMSAIALMGARCEYAASVNNGVATDQEVERDDGEGGLDGGLVVIVSTGDGDGGLIARQSEIVVAALSASIVSLPIARDSSVNPETPFAPGQNAHSGRAYGEVRTSTSRPMPGPVPEPGGILLFSLGLAAAAGAISRDPRAWNRDTSTRIPALRSSRSTARNSLHE